VSRAIGFILTITGLVLAVWFVRIVTAPELAPLQAFIVAAMAVAMISVGLRYVLKKKKKPEGTAT
jgi:heme/copper-type cytochrome/quinol oxidase subunit 4